jgi:transcriptional regulator with XRE-family HTH domain
MRKNFEELRAKMSPEARAWSKKRAREMTEEMLLTEIRNLTGFTQEEIAKKLGIKQPSLSKLESQDDMYVSTLRRLIEALGGRLEIMVHLPTGDIRVSQFEESNA